MKSHWMSLLMPLLPKHDVSHWFGRLVRTRLPGPLGPVSVQAFARAYRIDLREAELPLGSYKTIADLFTRKLRPGARPIGDWPVHPCDATITECGTVNQQEMIQAKGMTYSLPELLRSARHASTFEGGSYFTYYLCPTDYHRVHSPVDGRVTWSCHVPGELWPVNEWSVGEVQNLFSVNERVVMLIETPRGRAAVVMVAATNVGDIRIAFDENIVTTGLDVNERPVRERSYVPPKEVTAGAEIGVFHMGSTVIVLYEKGMVSPEALQLKGERAKMGVSLAPGASRGP